MMLIVTITTKIHVIYVANETPVPDRRCDLLGYDILHFVLLPSIWMHYALKKCWWNPSHHYLWQLRVLQLIIIILKA